MATPTDSAPARAELGTRHLAACAVRGLAAAGAVLLLAAGIGLVIWAVTPESGDVGPVLRGAVAALGAANYLPPSIGGIAVTIAPLLLTALCFGVVASAADRGRGTGVGVGAEWLGGLVVGVVYGAVVAAAVTALDPAGSANVGRAWAPVLLGVIAAGTGIAVRAPGWRGWWRRRAPAAVRVGVRGGGAAFLVLLVGGAVGVAAGLIRAFGTATDLSTMVAPSVGEGTGMLLLSLAFLPNAAVAGTAYSLGPGFQIGAGTYSPLGSNGVDLPALPLLAAVPDAGGTSWVGLVLAIFPVLAAVLLGWYVVRHLAYRWDRIAAAAIGAVLAGGLLAVLTVASGGGVQGSGWATLVVPALAVAGVALAGLLVLGAAVAATAGWGATPWSAAAEAAAVASAAEASADPDDPDDADPADADPADGDDDDYGDADPADGGPADGDEDVSGDADPADGGPADGDEDVSGDADPADADPADGDDDDSADVDPADGGGDAAADAVADGGDDDAGEADAADDGSDVDPAAADAAADVDPAGPRDGGDDDSAGQGDDAEPEPSMPSVPAAAGPEDNDAAVADTADAVIADAGVDDAAADESAAAEDAAVVDQAERPETERSGVIEDAHQPGRQEP